MVSHYVELDAYDLEPDESELEKIADERTRQLRGLIVANIYDESDIYKGTKYKCLKYKWELFKIKYDKNKNGPDLIEEFIDLIEEFESSK